MPGGMLSNIGISATSILEEHQPKGISPYLTLCWAYPQRVIIKVNNHTKYGGACRHIGEERPRNVAEFKVPRLARSWQELVIMLNAQGASAEGAST